MVRSFGNGRHQRTILIIACSFAAAVVIFMNRNFLTCILSSSDNDNGGDWSLSSSTSMNLIGNNSMNSNNILDNDELIKDTLPVDDYKLNLAILKYPLKEVNCHLGLGENTKPIIMHDTGTLIGFAIMVVKNKSQR